MSQTYTPKQIAQQLAISTTTLRRYEEQELLPEVPRTSSNRRIYTAVHLQAFITIRALLQAYEIPVVYRVMKHIQQGCTIEALWMLNQQLHDIQQEKQRLESMMAMIQQTELRTSSKRQKSDHITIGEAAQIAGVKPSAIRHWEKEGLVQSVRHAENGYRLFNERELRKIIVISSLRKTVVFIDSMKQLLNDLDTHHVANVAKSFRIALNKLNQQLTLQYQGIAEVMHYTKKMNL